MRFRSYLMWLSLALLALVAVVSAVAGLYSVTAVAFAVLLSGNLALSLFNRGHTGRLLARALSANRIGREQQVAVSRLGAAVKELKEEVSKLSASYQIVASADASRTAVESQLDVMGSATKEAWRQQDSLERRLLGTAESIRLSQADLYEELFLKLDVAEKRLVGTVEGVNTGLHELMKDIDRQASSINERNESRSRKLADLFSGTVDLLSGTIYDLDSRQERGNRALHETLESSLERLRLDLLAASADEDRRRMEGLDDTRNALSRTVEAGVARQLEHLTELALSVQQVPDIQEFDRRLEGLAVSVNQDFSRALKDATVELEGITSERVGVFTSTILDEVAQSGRSQVESVVKRVRTIAKDETREIESLFQLLPKVQPRYMMPSSGRWAMNARALLHLSELIQEHRPRRILELGSGASTIWLGYLAMESGAQIVSVEHDEMYLKRTEVAVARHDLGSNIEVRFAPLQPLEVGGDQFQWYSRGKFDDLQEVDMLLIDGPPGGVGPHARYPALPMLQPNLASNSIVLLDDFERDDERATVERWEEEFPDFYPMDEGVSQLAVLRRSNPNP